MTNSPDGSDKIDRLQKLASKLLDQRDKVAQLEAELAEAKEAARVTEQDHIAGLMDEIGMAEFTMASGAKLKLGSKIRFGNLSNPALHDFLRASGNAGLIKAEVTVPFKKGQDQDARELVEKLKAEQLAATFKQTVHWGSLESAIKKMMAEGTEVELAAIGGHEQRVVDVKLPVE